jgi:glycosyltransferase involved in cell wall biosynthesis
MNKIKVCILQNGIRHGGTDTFVINLCRGIDREKFEMSVVNPCNDEQKNILEDEVLRLGIPIIHTAGLEAPFHLLKHCWQLYRYLRQNKIDTFHTNVDLFNGPQLLVAKLAGVRNRICHSHNSQQGKQIEHPSWYTSLYQRLMRWLCWTCSSRQSGCSEAAMEFLFSGKPWMNQGFDPIVYNGIDLNRYRTPIDIDYKKRSLGITATKNILTVGRIFGQKNPVFLLNVFNEFCKKGYLGDLVWVGTGEQQQEVAVLAKKYNIAHRIHFLGARSDVNEIMQCCDMFLLPSKFEGLGIVLIEAQAAGLPCLASDVVPTLANCGGVEYLSLHASLDTWANKMNCTLSGQAPRIDRDRLEKFSIKNMCKQLEEIFTI